MDDDEELTPIICAQCHSRVKVGQSTCAGCHRTLSPSQIRASGMKRMTAKEFRQVAQASLNRLMRKESQSPETQAIIEQGADLVVILRKQEIDHPNTYLNPGLYQDVTAWFARASAELQKL